MVVGYRDGGGGKALFNLVGMMVEHALLSRSNLIKRLSYLELC